PARWHCRWYIRTGTIDSRSNVAMAITNFGVSDSQRGGPVGGIYAALVIDSRSNVAMAITNFGVSDSQRGGPVGGIYAALVPSIVGAT
ncbi:hypothetical protein J6590_108101, partial [Homalodisca vitripennis]